AKHAGYLPILAISLLRSAMNLALPSAGMFLFASTLAKAPRRVLAHSASDSPASEQITILLTRFSLSPALAADSNFRPLPQSAAKSASAVAWDATLSPWMV